jgi:hypothetical protein
MGDIPGRFLFGVEETADFERGTEREGGQDKEGPGSLFFYVSCGQYGPVLDKGELR